MQLPDGPLERLGTEEEPAPKREPTSFHPVPVNVPRFCPERFKKAATNIVGGCKYIE